MSLQLIQGGKDRPKVVLNAAVKQSLSDRFQYHGAKLSTLAWETGYSQGTLCAVIVEVARAEAMRLGRNQARFVPPMGVAA
jgi:hypothetical protein